MKLSKNAKHAIMLGTLCSISYFAVYIARNILGAVTPKIIANGVFNEVQIGSMSSLYFIAYAIGQLINGMIGDKIKAKYMIGGGLFIAAVTSFLFPYLSFSHAIASAAYGITGFSLSMIYAPMAKIVSENTDPSTPHGAVSAILLLPSSVLPPPVSSRHFLHGKRYSPYRAQLFF